MKWTHTFDWGSAPEPFGDRTVAVVCKDFGCDYKIILSSNLSVDQMTAVRERAENSSQFQGMADKMAELHPTEAPMEEDTAYYDPFADIAQELVEVHDRKGQDYGATGDPYRNVRMSEEFGIPAWIGVGIRMNDKMKRLQTASGQLLNDGDVRLRHEGLIDIANDIAVYGIILRIMIEEWLAAGNEDNSEGRM